MHLCKVWTLPLLMAEEALKSYPFGRNNMLEVAFLVAHLLWMTARAEIEMLYDMVTVAPARAMNIAGFGLEVGAPANLVVLGQSDVVEALRFHEAPHWVISYGRVVGLARMRQLLANKSSATG